MSIEQLATQGRDRLHGGLASVDTALLRHMRDKALRSCFRRLEETSHRMEHVATIHHKEYINDAAARSVNATLYTLQRIAGPVVWIAFGGDAAADYSVLQPVALRKVGKLICVGDDCHALHRAFGSLLPDVVDVPDIATAVAVASRSVADDVRVILSPATAVGEPTEIVARQYIHQVNEL